MERALNIKDCSRQTNYLNDFKGSYKHTFNFNDFKDVRPYVKENIWSVGKYHLGEIAGIF